MKALLCSVAIAAFWGGAAGWTYRQPAGQSPSANLHAGETFRDCPDCPEMVVMPGGSFLMGSPANEAGRDESEGPQRKVHIREFAAGKYDVTRGQWAAFASATNRPTEGGCAWAGPSNEKLDPNMSWKKLVSPRMIISRLCA